MPTLEIINERFARLLRIGLFNFVRRTAEISVGPVRVLNQHLVSPHKPLALLLHEPAHAVRFLEQSSIRRRRVPVDPDVGLTVPSPRPPPVDM